MMKTFILFTFLLSGIPQKKKITLWLIGDSTMSVKDVAAYPETGWGMPFAHFFDSTVKVENRAKNGRSTKSFRAEGLWKPVQNSIRPGDYVFIQFGHNDEGKDKIGRYTSPEEFGANLTRYVTETKKRGAQPILLTPVARRRFDSTGHVVESHTAYSAIVREVAAKHKVCLMDIDKKSMELLQAFGPDASSWLYLHLKKGEHPNYPEGKTDNTHFSELGARKLAGLVLADIKAQLPDLAERIVKPAIKN